MVPSQSQHHPPFFGMLVDLIRQCFCDAGDRERVLHPPVRRVGGWEDRGVGVHGVVVVDGVAQFRRKLGEEARGEEGGGGGFGAGFALPA